MKRFKRWLVEVDENKLIRRATFWNFLASILSSLMSAILLYFITKINGVNKAGMFSIASAIAYQCMSLGGFGVRNYHASDVNRDYEYEDYFYLRIFSCFLMYSLLIWYAFGNGYSLEKALIVFCFGLFKSVDTIEDLIHGEMQRKNRLDIGSILQSLRHFISIFLFVILLFISKNIVITCSVSTVVTLIVFLYLNHLVSDQFLPKKCNFNKEKTVKLFFACLPICIANAINMYIVNCPKYAIDAMLTDKFQTFFSVLSMPVFIINLLSTVIYRPYIKQLSDYWHEGEYKKVIKLLLKQFIIIGILTLIICIGGYVVGLTIIEFIYGINLHNYMSAFIFLLISGGLNAMANYLAVILTIQRQQSNLLIGYILTFVFAMFIKNWIVKEFLINGAAILSCLINLVSIVIFLILFIIKIIKQKKAKDVKC